MGHLSIPMTLARPQLAFFYALVGTTGSCPGGLFGYFLGTKLGRPLLMKLVKPASLKKLDALYTRLYFCRKYRFLRGSFIIGVIWPESFKIFGIRLWSNQFTHPGGSRDNPDINLAGFCHQRMAKSSQITG